MSGYDQEGLDVCIIVEGAYPFLVGGVSSWLQDLIENLPDVRFAIVAIKAGNDVLERRIKPPDNVAILQELSLTPGPGRPATHYDSSLMEQLAWELLDFMDNGGLGRLAHVLDTLHDFFPQPAIDDVLTHPVVFASLTRHFERTLPLSSFHHFFWALRTLLGGLLATLLAPFPRAKVYHTISTGFAGLLAARARIETGRPTLITEHGIYLLERQIEIMMADWIGDRIAIGLPFANDTPDLRDLWCRVFSVYARTCYAACNPIIALYQANSLIQARLGAAPASLAVIPNGVDLERFAAIRRQEHHDLLTVALIGRVVPIKDIETFIRAAAIILSHRADVMFEVLGPVDEDLGYAEECRDLVRVLNLGHRFNFAGRVQIDDWLPVIDVIVLTSLSEAQPLVILEAGACGIPSVASNVGSCREMLEGRPSDSNDGEPGGIITPLRCPEETASAILRLLDDEDLRRRMGATLRARVRRLYDRDSLHHRYAVLYETLACAASQPFVRG
jgi:glycosyltransferase involved in cell wall biosynthesis